MLQIKKEVVGFVRKHHSCVRTFIKTITHFLGCETNIQTQILEDKSFGNDHQFMNEKSSDAESRM